MRTNPLITALATSLLLSAAALPARAADEAEVTMAKADANKDGMVSKKEFLSTMSRLWDAKARKAAMKGDKMPVDVYEREILMAMRSGA